MISRLPKNIGLFCKGAILKRLYSAKETYIFNEPTNHSHPLHSWRVRVGPWIEACCVLCMLLRCRLPKKHRSLLQKSPIKETQEASCVYLCVAVRCNHTLQRCNTPQRTATQRYTQEASCVSFIALFCKRDPFFFLESLQRRGIRKRPLASLL